MNKESIFKGILIFLVAVLVSQKLIAQEEVYTDKNAPDRPKIQVGLGGGMLTYYGDIGYNKITQPMKFMEIGRASGRERV